MLLFYGCRGEVVPTDNDLSSYGWVMYESGDYVGALDWFITAIKEDSFTLMDTTVLGGLWAIFGKQIHLFFILIII